MGFVIFNTKPDERDQYRMNVDIDYAETGEANYHFEAALKSDSNWYFGRGREVRSLLFLLGLAAHPERATQFKKQLLQSLIAAQRCVETYRVHNRAQKIPEVQITRLEFAKRLACERALSRSSDNKE